ncbi:MAG: hypothetical protein ABJN39_11065 [Sulfitobacter sp.]|jgi:plastocyanin|uniref:Copper-binding protein n=2 Tax=Sulfitobacter TaxID=60136 RepID=A0ABW1Z1N6_9RHOB|nr:MULTISPECIES: hypothetical protein [Sulfitobacter]MCZ4367811.1 hypothetical protein [Sulfitobacter dubius]UWR29358.1 hypothetical protein K3758_13495 [Sulfitobacter sp. W002]UWR36878.1 hypothetical protein K3762_14010 [Sulfitobacter sp. W074]|tara:strand:- start:1893 stop:2225 length:333 start_codon:yes stop_codon:yes gene_type:complete
MMLSSYRKSAGALALALSVCAASAMAENRNVLIVDGAYFPALSHVQPGDQVVFTNNATGSHTITGEGDAWTSDAIPVNGSYTLDITAETPTTFSGQTLEEPAFEGAISFD